MKYSRKDRERVNTIELKVNQPTRNGSVCLWSLYITHSLSSFSPPPPPPSLTPVWLAFWSCQSNFISLFNAFIELNNMRWDNLPIITFTCQFLIIIFFSTACTCVYFLFIQYSYSSVLWSHAYSVARYLSSFENCYC